MAAGRLLFGIGGLAVGVIIGFMFANSINRSSSEAQATTAATAANVPANLNLPVDHPPVGARAGQQPPAQGGALPQVTEAIERAKDEPNSFEAQMTAGDLYYQIQRFADAAKFYEKANQIKPDELEPMIKLGNANFDAEQYEAAEKWYLEALKKTPNDTSIRTDLGLTYYLRAPRQIDKAIKEFQTVLNTEPNKEITLQNLALAFRESGDTANFEKTVERLRKINPNNPVVTRANGL